MTEHRTGLDTVRDRVTAFLRERGVDAVSAWPEKERTRGTRPVAAVSLRKCEGGPSGFRDYLGERYNEDAGRWEELYGRRVKLTFGLDLYARGGKDGGAAGVELAFDQMAQALGGEGPEGLRILALSRGETKFDQGAGLYQCLAEAVCEGYLYAVADEGGAFLEFTVRGDVKQ